MENVLYDSVLGTYLFEIVVITCTIGLHKVKLFVARPKTPPLLKKKQKNTTKSLYLSEKKMITF